MFTEVSFFKEKPLTLDHQSPCLRIFHSYMYRDVTIGKELQVLSSVCVPKGQPRFAAS